MPFLLPALPALMGIGGGIAGLAGAGSQSQYTSSQNALLGAQAQNEALRNMLTQDVYPQFKNIGMGALGYSAQADPLSQLYNNFLETRMNLGSPYYQQHQRQAFENEVGQAQQAAGQAQQQLALRQQGFAPTGLTAGTLGGIATGENQQLATNFLQNLFQNENLQMQAGSQMPQAASIPLQQASERTQMMGMLNPAQYMGNAYAGYPGQVLGPSLNQSLGAIGQGIGSLGGLWGQGGGSPTNIGAGGPNVYGTGIPQIGAGLGGLNPYGAMGFMGGF